MKLGTKLGLSFCAVTSLLIVAVGATVWQVRKASVVTDRVFDVRFPTREASLLMQSGINQSLAALRGWVIVRDDKFKEERRMAWEKQIKPSSVNLKRFSRYWNDDEQLNHLDIALKKLTELENFQSQVENSIQNTAPPNGIMDKQTAEFFKQIQLSMEEINAHLEAIIGEQKLWLGSDMGWARKQIHDLRILQYLILLFGIVVASFLSVFLIQGITAPLQLFVQRAREIAKASGDLTTSLPVTSKDEIGELANAFNNMIAGLKDIMKEVQGAAMLVNTATTEINAASSAQASGAAQQSSGVAQSLATAEELAATAEQIAKNAKVVRLTAEKTLGGMTEIQTKVSDTARKILSLGEKSQSIGNVVKIIAELAEQTNLLALNAAIEAAHAGDSGRGFAVVANEVRKLSERSAESTNQIRSLIAEIQAGTNAAVMGIEESIIHVGKGVDMVQQSVAQVKEISLATYQQKTGAEQVVIAVKNIDQVSKQFVGATKQVSMAAQRLDKQAKKLKESVGEFKLGN
ncbi:MAG: HAMP domain-containing protein [Candidatus Omnitrophica bacterium]|nr:HAMP domain-containing protein [Candidatus Omnitrophota bacterium]